MVTALLHFDCGASITESDYTAPSSPCSTRCSSDWLDTTNEVVELFQGDSFPLLGAEQRPQQPTQHQQPQQCVQHRRRHKGPSASPNTLWQHILQKLPIQDLAVGMKVRLVEQRDQVGILLKREGSQRVRVAFFASRGKPIYRWLNPEQVEPAPAGEKCPYLPQSSAAPKEAPAYEKCPHPPQSLEAKLWYKEQKRV